MLTAHKITAALTAALLTLIAVFGAQAATPATAAATVSGAVTEVQKRGMVVAVDVAVTAESETAHGVVVSLNPVGKSSPKDSVGAKFVPADKLTSKTTLLASAAKLKPGTAYELLLYPANANGAAEKTEERVLARFALHISDAQWDELQKFKQPKTVGEISWGFRESFIRYITGPIAHGKITVIEPASRDRVFRFPQAKDGNTYDPGTGTGTVQYAGAVTFFGHEGALNFGLYNPKIAVRDSKTAVLIVAGDGGKELPLADIDLRGAQRAEDAGTITWTGAKTTLRAEGRELLSHSFGGAERTYFYEVGEELAPITFTIGQTGTAELNEAPEIINNNSAGSASAAPRPNQSAAVANNLAAQAVVSRPEAGSFGWGISTSFARYVAEGYVAGRATPVNTKGQVTANGVAGGIGGFVFPQIDSSFDFGAETGSVSYGGSVNFYAHGGLLNLTFGGLRITVVNPQRAEMYANGVHWGSLDLTTAQRSKTPNGAITWAGATFIPGAGAGSFLASDYDRSGKIGFDRSVTFTVGSAGSASGGAVTTAGNAATPSADAGEAKSATQAEALESGFKRMSFSAAATDTAVDAAVPQRAPTTNLTWAWWTGAGVLTVIAAGLVTALLRRS